MEATLLETKAKEINGLKEKTWTESKKLWKVAFPAILSRLSTFGALVVTQAFMGHISELDLSAYALIQVITFQLSNGILMGMSSATETLCGQAFGAGQYHMLGIYLQRSWIINLFTSTIMLPLYIFATPIYRLLGQDEDIAKEAGKVSLYFIPVIYQYAVSWTVQQYLQAQLRNIILAWLAVGSFVIHLFLSWIFVYVLDLGVPGAMGALIASSWLTSLGQFVYVFGGWCPGTWTGFGMAAFSDLWPMVKLSVSSGVMLCLELWYNSILVLLAGYMKNASVSISAFSICLNITTWELMMILGFTVASSVRVSNELGRGDAKAAKFSIKVILSTSLTIGTIFWILCLVFGHDMSYLFTSNAEIAQYVSSLSILVAFTILVNSIQPVLTGVAVGVGMQGIVAYVNIASYYLIGLPVGILLGYVAHLHIKGIWIGMISGITIQTIVVCYITWRIDWNKEVNKASERLKIFFSASSNEADCFHIEEYC